MGPQAIPLLRAAAVASDPVVRAESLRALANYRGEGVADVLAAAALNTNEPESVRSMLNRAMRDQGYSTPASSELVSRLQTRADALLTGRQMVRGSLDPMVTVWRWDSETKRLQASRVTLATASRVEAARLATEAYGIEPHSTLSRRLYLLTQLEAAKRMLGTEGESAVVSSKDFFKDLPASIGTIDSQEINNLLKFAVEKKAVPCSDGMLRTVGRDGRIECVLLSRQPDASGRPSDHVGRSSLAVCRVERD